MIPRANLAALDATTGAPTTWDPGADGPVAALAATSAGIVVGGSFAHVGGVARGGLAVVSAAGAVGAFDAQLAPGPEVTRLESDSAAVYVLGRFATAAGQPRNQVAAFALPSLTLTAFAPAVTGTPDIVHPAADGVYIASHASTFSARPSPSAPSPRPPARRTWPGARRCHSRICRRTATVS